MNVLALLTPRHRATVAFALGLALGRTLGRGRGPAHDKRHAASIGHGADAVIALDHDQRIVMATPAAAALFGVTMQQMQGNALSRFVVGADLDKGNGASRAGRRATDQAMVGLHADGRRLALAASLSQVMHQGRPVHSLVLRDAAARERVQARLARWHDEVRQLSGALQTMREQERTHIARELHDDLGQLLAALRMDLVLLQQADANSELSLSLMDGMQANLGAALASLRRIATNLRPRALDGGGLYAALQGLRDEFSQRYHIACTLDADEAELQLDDAASTAVYRVVQEALTNIARHADARNVTVNLYRLNGELLLNIRDDGRGISADDLEKAGSLGLVGMRERVWGMQGDIAVSSDEPPGTRIDIVLPVEQHQL